MQFNGRGIQLFLFTLIAALCSAVYFYEAKLPIEGKEFLAQDVTARNRVDGMHRLQGSCDVEKWKSNVDFRIRLAMHSSEPDP
jgi:hypothetical protein